MRHSLVVVREDFPGQKHLVAYVVVSDAGAGDGRSSETSLRGALKARLPDYMVPSAFVFLREFPLTPNGKIDRKALPKPDQPEQETAEESELPRTPLETTLSEIWMEVLGLERMGIKDNFFRLGGHSLLALRVISRIRQQLDIDAPLSPYSKRPVSRKWPSSCPSFKRRSWTTMIWPCCLKESSHQLMIPQVKTAAATQKRSFLR